MRAPRRTFAPCATVVRGDPRRYRRCHPSKPILAVEVSDTSLLKDRRLEAALYARAGIAEYWILNLGARVLEVYREPLPSSTARYGFRYKSVRLLRGGAVVTPLAAPRSRVAVSDLLP